MIISLSATCWIRAQIWWGKKVGGGSVGGILVRSNLFFRGSPGQVSKGAIFMLLVFVPFLLRSRSSDPFSRLSVAEKIKRNV